MNLMVKKQSKVNKLLIKWHFLLKEKYGYQKKKMIHKFYALGIQSQVKLDMIDQLVQNWKIMKKKLGKNFKRIQINRQIKNKILILENGKL